MSASQRTTLISAGRKKAGRQAQSLTLTSEFDEVLRDMTERYRILPKSSTGTLTADTSYITMPSDYSDRRFMTVDTFTISWMDPDVYLNWLATNTDVASMPTHYTVVREDAKVYLKNKPSTAWTYYFYYWGIHPAASGDTYTHLLEDKFEEVIVFGLAYKACELIEDFAKAKYWQANYERELLTRAGRTNRLRPVARSTFWGAIR